MQWFWTGPTSFAPIIEMAMTIVEQSGGQYHVLLIIADGQVLCSSCDVASNSMVVIMSRVGLMCDAHKFRLGVALLL